jgi:hypothetical protein
VTPSLRKIKKKTDDEKERKEMTVKKKGKQNKEQKEEL